MKNIKCIYELYVPTILRNKNGIKYNLSDDNIFGNLNYSMNTNLLKGKTIEADSHKHLISVSSKIMNNKPVRLIPIIRIKPK